MILRYISCSSKNSWFFYKLIVKHIPVFIAVSFTTLFDAIHRISNTNLQGDDK